MAYADKPPLSPGRIVAILMGLALLGSLSVWHLRYRQAPVENSKASDPRLPEFSGETMGAYYVVKIFPDGTADSFRRAEVETAIQRELDNVDRKMSTYRDDSELSRFNRTQAPEPFQFSDDTFDVIQLSQRISEQTGGAFDITVGPLVAAWGFGANPSIQSPNEKQAQHLKQIVGYRLLTLDGAQRTVTKAHPEVEIDLSAVAPGYAVDRIAMALEDLGVMNYMIELGGEVRTGGKNSEGQPWQIGIEVPDDRIGGVHRIVGLSGLALATSGDYRNFVERDGEIFSHTMDPRAGRPVPQAVASVSVIHHECAYADALATAMIVLGVEEGLKLANEIGLPVLFLVHSDGGFEERSSTAFTTLL